MFSKGQETVEDDLGPIMILETR